MSYISTVEERDFQDSTIFAESIEPEPVDNELPIELKQDIVGRRVRVNVSVAQDISERTTDLDIGFLSDESFPADGAANIKERMIGLSTKILEEEAPNPVEAYTGIGLHELGHLEITPGDAFEHQIKTTFASTIGMSILNWVEDERVENFMRERVGFFRGYFAATKQTIFDERHKETDANTPTLKFVKIISYCLRRPSLLTDEDKKFQFEGSCVYEDLQEILGAVPGESFSETVNTGTQLLDYTKRKLKQAGEQIKEVCNKKGEDFSKALSERYGQEGKEIGKSLKLGKEKDEIKFLTQGRNAPLSEEEKNRIKEIVEVIKNVIEEISKGELSLIGAGGSEEDSKEKPKELPDKVIKANEQNFSSDERYPVKIIYSGEEIEKESAGYAGIYTSVFKPIETELRQIKPQIGRLRRIFTLRSKPRHFTETELKEGKLHRRKLAIAGATSRVYKQDVVKYARGMNVILLMDESGSMFGGMKQGGESKLAAARKSALLLGEAFKIDKGNMLQILSYSSYSSESFREDGCLVKYLYGPLRRDIKKGDVCAALEGYKGLRNNYDHLALQTANMFFEGHQGTRILIVMSDGFPAGYKYGGETAIKICRQTVEKIEKQGTFVFNIAIEDYQSEAIYNHSVKFLNAATLVSDLRKVVTQITKRIRYSDG